MRLHAYHKKHDLPTAEIAFREGRARSQDELVLSVFEQYWYQDMSPSQVYDYLVDRLLVDAATPLTSIRRAITNLTTRGELVKLEKKTQGPWGHPEGLWRLRLERDLPLFAGGRTSER